MSDNHNPSPKSPRRQPAAASLPPTGDELKLVRQIPLEVHQQRLQSSGGFNLFLPPEECPVVYSGPIHSTDLRNWTTCRRKYMFSARCGLYRRGAYVPSLSIGTLYHTLLEGQALGGKTEDLIASSTVALATWLDREVRPLVVPGLGLLPSGVSYDHFKEKALRDLYLAGVMAKVYHRRYPVDEERFEPIKVEEAVTAELIGVPGAIITGKFDMVLRERKTGHLWIVDHKTTGKSPITLLGGLPFDVQTLLYRMLAWAAYPQERIVGFIHGIIRKPTIRFSPDTLDAPVVRHTSEIANKLSSRKELTERQEAMRRKEAAQIAEDQGIDPYIKYLRRVSAWYSTQEAIAGDEHLPDQQRQEAIPFLWSESLFTTRSIPSDFLDILRGLAAKGARGSVLSNFPRCCNNYVCTGGSFGGACEYLPICRLGTNYGLWKGVIRDHYEQDHRDLDREDI